MKIKRILMSFPVIDREKSVVHYAVFVIALSWIYALLTQITINFPFGLVPITLQTLFLFVAASTLGPVAVHAYTAYYLQGLCGAPFFSNMGSGIIHLVGPTGGYLLGFFFSMCFLSAVRTYKKGSYIFTFGKYVAAEAIFYVFGLFQLSFFVPHGSALAYGFYPFLVGDIVKMVIGTACIVLLGVKESRS